MRRAAPSFSPLMAPISTFPRGKSLKNHKSNLQSQAAEATVARAYRPASFTALLLCPQASTQGGGGLPGGMRGHGVPGDVWM